MSEELEERTGDPVHTGPAGSTDRTAGDPGAPSYGAEIEAERRGLTADEVAEQTEDEEDSALDSAYKPRSG